MTSAPEHPLRIPMKNRFIGGAIERILKLDKIIECYDKRPTAGGSPQEFLDYLLGYWGIRLQIKDKASSLEKIPKEGPLLIVANHPLGGLEGIALTQLLLKIRPDLKVVANKMLVRMPEFQPIFIGVDVLSATASRENVRGVLDASRHLDDGGALLLFPAGKVSHLNTKTRRVEDHAWNRLAGKLLQRSGATCVPIHVGGYNSKLFYSLGLIHPRLRTVLLPRELVRKKNSKLELIFGDPILPNELRHLDTPEAITNYLRLSTEFLALGKTRERTSTSLAFQEIDVSSQKTEAHMETLHEFRLITSGVFEIYCAPYDQLGPVMHEIGIVREITFRAAGEGTGKPIDSDQFDPHYQHLFIWDTEHKRIAGGYRIGQPKEIVDQHGIDAIYARTLFDFDRDYLKKIGPSLEMGRSFVVPDYQRHPKVLDLLWRGIGAYIARNPNFHTLFGAVSISREYSSFAQALIAESMEAAFAADKQFTEDVHPIIPLKVSGKPWSATMLATIKNVSALNKLVGRCDPKKTLPILLRHYLALNGKFVCFSVNKGFNDSLDGLILVDLRKMPQKYLKRYLGKDGAIAFTQRWESTKENSTNKENELVKSKSDK